MSVPRQVPNVAIITETSFPECIHDYVDSPFICQFVCLKKVYCSLNQPPPTSVNIIVSRLRRPAKSKKERKVGMMLSSVATAASEQVPPEEVVQTLQNVHTLEMVAVQQFDIVLTPMKRTNERAKVE